MDQQTSWRLLHEVRWTSWLPVALLDSMAETFFALLGLGAFAVGVAALLGVGPSLGASLQQPRWQTLVVTLVAGALSLVPLFGIRARLVDVFAPARADEGLLRGLAQAHVPGTHGGYRVWVLDVEGASWEIPCLEAKGLAQTLVGRRVRVAALRGTRTVTGLWVESPAARRSRP